MTDTTTVLPVDPDLARRLRQAGRKADEWTDARDRLVVEAHQAGASLREIAAVVGLTHAGVRRIVIRDQES